LVINLLAAHMIRFHFSVKRLGIILIHAGLVVMLVNELVRQEMAVEAYMQIEEGSSANYASSNRIMELLLIDPSDSKSDDVFAIPQSRLRPGHVISADELPVDIEVLDYMANSSLEEATKSPFSNPANAGIGTHVIATPQKEVSGAEQSV